MSGFKKYSALTYLIGFGFFTMGLMDPLYDTYVPIYLEKFFDSKVIIGLVMTLDNILAIFMIPLFAFFSDNTRTKYGRRMPYIVCLLPITAILFGLIPISALSDLWWVLAVTIFAMNIFKQAVRGPVVALMPDSIPGDYRSQANGVINFMGGMGTILGALGLSLLMKISIKLPFMATAATKILSFPVAGLFVLAAVVMLMIFIKEKQSSQMGEKNPSILKSIRHIIADSDRSALKIMLSLFFWFWGYQGVLPFLGLYSKNVIGLPEGMESYAAGVVAVMYAIAAIPAGKFAESRGRKTTIRKALIVLVAILAVTGIHSLIISSPALSATILAGGLAQILAITSFYLILAVFGVFWVTVVVNSFPMLWQMSDFSTVGIYTGLYYFFSQFASITAPPITGFIIDTMGYPGIFGFASMCMLVAFFFMKGVKKGEIVSKPEGELV